MVARTCLVEVELQVFVTNGEPQHNAVMATNVRLPAPSTPSG
jgi:hypothetical protein